MNMLLKTVEATEVKETRATQGGNASGCPRDFLDNRFVYVVVSARARGLSIGLNINPDQALQFRLRLLRGQSRRTPLVEALNWISASWRQSWKEPCS